MAKEEKYIQAGIQPKKDLGEEQGLKLKNGKKRIGTKNSPRKSL